MKGLLLVMALTVPGFAQDAAPSAVEFISEQVKRAEGASAVNLGGKFGAAIFVPLRTLNWPVANILDTGIGGAGGFGKPEALASVRLNLPQVVNAIFGTSLFVKNTHGPRLPSLFLGPAVKAAWPVSSWTWKNDAMFLLSIPFNNLSGLGR